jgi:hypothetical protein
MLKPMEEHTEEAKAYEAAARLPVGVLAPFHLYSWHSSLLDQNRGVC